jgi:hypothetical protein
MRTNPGGETTCREFCTLSNPRQDHEHQNIKIMMRTNPWRGDMVHPKILILIAWICLLSMSGSAQDTNRVVYDSLKSQQIINGYCDREFLEKFEPFLMWSVDEYDNYTPSSGILEALDSLMTDVSIVIVLATWCGDSKEQVPRFLRVLDDMGFEGGFPAEKVTLICVDGRKQTLSPDITPLDIQKVPTFIIYRGAQELGRIIETPATTLEADLLEIINGKKP